MSKYGTITSLAESPLVEGLIYAGTDDGLIQVTEDGGENWRKIDTLPGVPDVFFVNDIKADLHDADTVYVVGRRPQDRRLLAVPAEEHRPRPELDAASSATCPSGTSSGASCRITSSRSCCSSAPSSASSSPSTAGGSWIKLSGGVPNIPFRDLAIQTTGERPGRRHVRPRLLRPRRLHAAAPGLGGGARSRRRCSSRCARPGGTSSAGRSAAASKASQGAAFFTAPNPPFGAVFTYYLRDEIADPQDRRAASRRRRSRRRAATRPIPGWDELRARAARRGAGDRPHRARRRRARSCVDLTGPVKAGFHRVAWDLRYPSVAPWQKTDDGERRPRNRGGVLAAPGTYTVSLARQVDGEFTDLGVNQTFEVVLMQEGTLDAAPPDQVVAFLKELSELQREVQGANAAVRGALERVEAIRETLMRSTASDPSLGEEVRSLEQRLNDFSLKLNGERSRGMMGDPGPVSIDARISFASRGNRLSTYGPTPTHRQSVEIAEREFDALRPEIDRLIDVDLPALERKLDEAGVPWTPGRGIPSRK